MMILIGIWVPVFLCDLITTHFLNFGSTIIVSELGGKRSAIEHLRYKSSFAQLLIC